MASFYLKDKVVRGCLGVTELMILCIELEEVNTRTHFGVIYQCWKCTPLHFPSHMAYSQASQGDSHPQNTAPLLLQFYHCWDKENMRCVSLYTSRVL